MMKYLGDFREDATVRFMWNTFNVTTGASITRATDGTVSVYKDGGATQSTAGITDTEDFDSLTGVHYCEIDTSVDSFYAAGSDYTVVLSGAVINGATVNAALAEFSIENRPSSMKIEGDAVYKDMILKMVTYLVKNGEVVTGTTTATASIYDIDGTLVEALSSDASPDSQGVFKFSSTLSTELTEYSQYYVKVTITDPDSAVISGIIPIKRFS